MLSDETVTLVKKIYEDDDFSRLMAGKNDFVSLKQDNGKREHVQKRLLLGNLNELYAEFKKQHANVKIGFTQFTQLRPLNCVFARSSRTHTVCVCKYQENFKLQCNAIDIGNLTKNSKLILKDYRDCLNAIVCSNPASSCFFADCKNCPGTKEIKEILIELFDEYDINEIKFDSWLQTDRCTLKTILMTADEFDNDFCQRLEKLKTHDFIAKQQSLFVKNLKEKLLPGELVITCDFAGNYAFVVKNSTQSFHWNNNQATVLTVVCYYKMNNESSIKVWRLYQII